MTMPKKIKPLKNYFSFSAKYLAILAVILALGLGIFWQVKARQNLYVGDDFSISVPTGWINQESQVSQISAMFVNQEEMMASPAASFQSYLAVSSQKEKGKSLNDIVEEIKQAMVETGGEAKVENESDGFVGGQFAKFMEIKMSSQEKSFSSLFVIIPKGDNFFYITAHTTSDRWDNYKNTFYQTAKSFKTN
jgi:hypothetical protein